MSQNNETVFVVVPLFNAKKVLRDCVRSIQKQTYPNIRIVLVDDGSTDGSGALCDKLAEEDARIQVLHQNNAGCFAARCAGTMLCDSGETDYVCFCDADDRLPPASVQTLLDACLQNDADISMGPWNRIWHGVRIHSAQWMPANELIDHERFLSEFFCSWYGITRMPVSLCSKMFRVPLLQAAYRAVPPGTTTFFGEDLVVSIRACTAAKRLVSIPDVTYDYTVGGGTSRFRPNMLREFIGLYRYKMDFAEPYLDAVPQDLRLLSDIELCNVAFTYFRTLMDEKKIPPQRRREIMLESVRLPEIRAAAEHVLSSDYEKKAYAQMIAGEDLNAIEREAQPVSLLRKVLTRLKR
ncbi:MAG: glycosyltransferase [Clostridia bacterium]|nr:glycosyltransferase [Clostridia bacterium]